MCQLVCRGFLVSVVWRLTQEQEQDINIQRDDGGHGTVPAAAAQSGVPGVPPYDGIPGVSLPGVLPAGVPGNAAVPAPAPGPVRRTTPLTTASCDAIDACAPGGAPGPVQDQGQGQGQLWLPVPRLWQDLHPRLAAQRWGLVLELQTNHRQSFHNLREGPYSWLKVSKSVIVKTLPMIRLQLYLTSYHE